jgi:polyphosphate kinase
MPQQVRDRIRWELRFERGAEGSGVSDGDVYEVDGMLDLRSLRELGGADIPGGRFPPLASLDPFAKDASIWQRLESGDVLVHHPYEDFGASVVRFFAEAAEDPLVTSVRVTLYRVGEASPIVDALLRARAAGKEVVLFVELKARFDEARNIAWVQRLEDAGATVVYGVVGLKNHAKVGLVLRREGDSLRRYVHIGTGNYNAATAKQYTDLGLFSAETEVGADIQDFFNELTGSSHPPSGAYRRIAVAPSHLLPWLLRAIEMEIAHARAGREARIRAKINGLADAEVIRALYRASEAGVEVELVVRGLCTLRPGLPGLSSRIRVVSVLGRFLEHARIYYFANGGDHRYAIGSADWRQRNLRRRVEVVVPVESPEACTRLQRILDVELADPTAWELRHDGTYERRTGSGDAIGSQAHFALAADFPQKALPVSQGSAGGT